MTDSLLVESWNTKLTHNKEIKTRMTCVLFIFAVMNNFGAVEFSVKTRQYCLAVLSKAIGTPLPQGGEAVKPMDCHPLLA